MSEFDHNPRDLMEAYVDGTLSPEERAAFERAMDESAELREAVTLQRRIDARLRERLSPPAETPASLYGLAALDSVEKGDLERQDAPAASASWRKWTGLAAVIVIGVTIGLVGLSSFEQWLHSPTRERERSPLETGQLYAQIVQAGYTVDWVCETDKEFLETTIEKLGTPLLVEEAPGLEIVGWKYIYRPVLSFSTQILLTKVDDEPVIVLMDTVDDAHREVAAPSGEDGLRLFHRQIGDVVLYEISPREQPAVLDRFYVVEQASAKKAVRPAG